MINRTLPRVFGRKSKVPRQDVVTLNLTQKFSNGIYTGNKRTRSLKNGFIIAALEKNEVPF